MKGYRHRGKPPPELAPSSSNPENISRPLLREPIPTTSNSALGHRIPITLVALHETSDENCPVENFLPVWAQAKGGVLVFDPFSQRREGKIGERGNGWNDRIGWDSCIPTSTSAQFLTVYHFLHG